MGPGTPPYAQPPRPKGGFPVWLIVVLVTLLVVVASVGVLATLAIFGVRKFLAQAKTAEARNSLVQLGRLATESYERDGKLCRSASRPIPESVPHATKYVSSEEDWLVDRAAHAGFACLDFAMTMPQYYQYEYRATETSFTITARGDLNGNRILSNFVLEGRVKDGAVEVAPSLRETTPDE
jgi:type IV pilus assembly protein PilA